MKSRPGDIYRNINPKVGISRFTMDVIVKQHIPELVIEPIIEEPIQEIKQEENELQRTQVEQTTLSSGSEYTREHSTGDKQNPPRKSRV
jgi:hypothetical protein